MSNKLTEQVTAGPLVRSHDCLILMQAGCAKANRERIALPKRLWERQECAGVSSRFCCSAWDRLWPFASFRCDVLTCRLQERSGHRPAAKTRWIGRE